MKRSVVALNSGFARNELRILVFALLLFFCVERESILACNFQDTQKSSSAGEEANSQEKSQFEDLALFAPMLRDNTLNLNYFLDEINIVGDQKKKLQNIARDSHDDYIAVFTKRIQEQQSGIKTNPEEARTALLAVQKKLISRFEDVLLTQQMSGLRKLLRQRAKLKSKRVESFMLPMVLSNELDFPKEQLPQFGAFAKKCLIEFENKKEELQNDAWTKIKVELSDDSTDEMLELFSMVERLEKLDRNASNRDSTSVEKWTKEDFDRFEEKKYLLSAFLIAPNFPPLRKELGILDSQAKEITSLVQSANADRKGVGRVDPTYAKLVGMTSSDDLKDLKEEINESQNAELEFQRSLANRIAESVLLPQQVEKLKTIARFTRLMQESKYGDSFGAAIAWSRTNENLQVDRSTLAKVVDDSRSKYYANLTKLRKETNKKVLDAMPDQCRQIFESLYGEMYDLESERVAGWDESRKGG